MIRRDLESRGSIFHTDVDTEVIAHLIARSDATTLEEAIASALPHLEGAYSLVILSQEAAFAIRDAFGVRPLSIGRIGDGHVIASETCALDLVRASHERDVKPGEMVVFEFGKPPRSRFPLEPKPSQNCVFELIYFARPDSRVFGRGVYNARFRMGERLAAEAGAEADIVIPVPDSGVPAALGFAKGAAVEYGLGLIRSHYVGRTFIEPSGSIRDLGVKLKLNPVRELIEGRRVVVVDDSIVRGTTCKKIVKLLRESGAREVHFRVASPATLWPCFYGIDTPDRTQLIAANHSVDEIREFIGADSLGYLSLDGLRLSVGSDGTSFCEACLTGHYAAGVIPERDRRSAR
jgi:amidophosphoribosyltransferase